MGSKRRATDREVFSSHFGAALRAARKRRRLDIFQLGEAVGGSASAVQRWESGKTLPDAFQLGRLFSVLGGGMADVLGHRMLRKKSRL